MGACDICSIGTRARDSMLLYCIFKSRSRRAYFTSGTVILASLLVCGWICKCKKDGRCSRSVRCRLRLHMHTFYDAALARALHRALIGLFILAGRDASPMRRRLFPTRRTYGQYQAKSEKKKKKIWIKNIWHLYQFRCKCLLCVSFISKADGYCSAGISISPSSFSKALISCRIR